MAQLRIPEDIYTVADVLGDIDAMLSDVKEAEFLDIKEIASMENDEKLEGCKDKENLRSIVEKSEIKETSDYIFRCTGGHYQIKFEDNLEPFTRQDSLGLRYIHYLLQASLSDRKDVFQTKGIKARALYELLTNVSSLSLNENSRGHFDLNELKTSDDGSVTTKFQVREEMNDDIHESLYFEGKLLVFWEPEYEEALNFESEEERCKFLKKNPRKQVDMIEEKIENLSSDSNDPANSFIQDENRKLLEEFLENFYERNNGQVKAKYKVSNAIGDDKKASQAIQKAIKDALIDIATPPKGNPKACSVKLITYLKDAIQTGKSVKITNTIHWKLT